MMWLRVYFLVRTILSRSIYTDAYSRKLCRFYGFEAGVKYTIKCMIQLEPERTCIALLSSTILIFAHAAKIFETPYFRAEDDIGLKSSMDSYLNAIWMTVITLTTVGYGDLYPCTTGGRIVIMTLALWGSFIMSLLVVML